jgi:hypothetical protein
LLEDWQRKNNTNKFGFKILSKYFYIWNYQGQKSCHQIAKILFDLDIKNANFQTSFEVLDFSIVLLQGRKIPKKDQFHQAILLIHVSRWDQINKYIILIVLLF